MKKELHRIETEFLLRPEHWDMDTVYVLVPQMVSHDFYYQRTKRNLGWITEEEQEIIKNSVVSIAGCGGMGGAVALGLLRMGVGEIRIADPEVFEVSNLNRQAGCTMATLGLNKALSTAREARCIAPDTKIVVYPMGIQDEIVDEFVAGSDVLCDLIEFFIVWYRSLVHERARKHGVSIFNCNTVGHSTNLFLYTPESITMEEVLGLSKATIHELREAAEKGVLAKEERSRIAQSMMRAVIPEGIPEYADSTGSYRTCAAVTSRLHEEGVASIITPGPMVAAGFLTTHILLQLLKRSQVKRNVVMVPPMPGYMRFDAAHMTTSVIRQNWMNT